MLHNIHCPHITKTFILDVINGLTALLWTEEQYKAVIFVWPLHWRRGPAALNPGEQSQRYDPSVFTHTLCGPHKWGLTHSSMSEGKTAPDGLAETVHKHTSWPFIHFIFALQHRFILTFVSYFITLSSALALPYYVNHAFCTNNRYNLVFMTFYTPSLNLWIKQADFCSTVPLRRLYDINQ